MPVKSPEVPVYRVALSSSGRFSPLLRWIGITLVVLLLLQMLAVLGRWDWSSEAFRQLVVERLIQQAPMALVGLLLMYLSSRLEDGGEERKPVLWAVCLLSGLLAVLLTASLPAAFGGDGRGARHNGGVHREPSAAVAAALCQNP
jgi:hypothetical protein